MPPELLEAIDLVGAAAADLREADLRIRKRRTLRSIERRLERDLAKAWRVQGKDFLRRFATLESKFKTEALREAVSPEDWEALFTESALATLSVLREPLSLAAAASLRLGARHAIADLAADLTFALADPEAVAYLADVGATRVAGINEVTRDRLRTLLADARAGGWSYDRTAAEIRRTFVGFGTPAPQQHIRSRAHLVAVTETGDAYEASRRMMANRLASAGLQLEKAWLAVGDARTDADCLANDSQGWIAVDGVFTSGHEQPTAHPACRCTTEYRRKPS
ncbi:MAG TPA: phage minor head protein [Candidatus Limnocylindrales bacterium]|nr:phage minor head protein [Candidatus Limnocylindrales bacterium]